MAEPGEEKLIAMARHIAKTLGHTDPTSADDILQIFSSFDGRLREKLLDNFPPNPDTHPRTSAALDQTLNSLDRQISRFVSADHPIWSDSADSSSFLISIDSLITLIREFSPMSNDKTVFSSLDRAKDLLQHAMFRLEDEFKLLIERGGESFDSSQFRNGESNPSYFSDSAEDEEEDDDDIPTAYPITDYNIVIDALPSSTINDLHEISKRMVVAGYGKLCSHAYSACRREFLEESLSRLGLQKLSIDEVHKLQWSELEYQIDRWHKPVHVAMKILFPSERRLCDRVFFGFSSASDSSFMAVCRGSAIQLLSFADAVATRSRAPERVFKVLDAYETVRDLMPEFEEVFADQYCLFLRNEAAVIMKRLGEAIRGIFDELENLIRRDPAKSPVPGGGTHPMTKYVMNYLRVACERQTLEQVFEESVALPSGSGGDYRKMDERSMSLSSLSDQMAWIMHLLESNLETKSKLYRDPALCSVFMMNNGRYILQKVKDGELESLLGEDWIRKHNAKLRQYQVTYQRSTWSKVLGVLKIDSSPLKEKFKLFSLYFEEICRTQSTWVIADDGLREELRSSIAGNLLPAYRNFIAKLQSVPYSVEELEASINELFQGSGGSTGGRN